MKKKTSLCIIFRVVQETQDPELKELYKKDCSVDYSECCKLRSTKRVPKIDYNMKKREIKKEPESKPESKPDPKSTASIISKISSTIQVK